MRYQQKIYNQNGNKVRNRDLLNVNMSSDICIFSAPTFNVSGATKIETGTTSASTGVYLVDDDAGSIDLTFSFTGNVSSFDSESIFKYEIHKYNHDNKVFTEPAIIRSEEIPYTSFSATSAITQSIPVSGLSIDGDYLIKGYYTHEVCTDILGRLGERNDTSIFKNGSLYGLYNPSIDYYFAVIEKAETPIFTDSIISTERPLGSLVAFSVLPDVGTTQIPIRTSIQGDLLVYLNGLLLARDLDYTITVNNGVITTGFTGTITVVTLNEPTVEDDIFTYASVSDKESNGIVVDNIIVESPIPSGPTDGQDENTYYLNTTENKYEIYTTLNPIGVEGFVVTLNGVTLAPNIDYYQSISNPNRIILEGNLLAGDIINIVYNAYPSYVGEIYTNTPIINWTIPVLPQSNNGIFTLEAATDTTFGNIVSSAQTEYVVNQASYNAQLTITGSVGTNLVYRVLNEKNYTTVDGEIISTSTYSEIIPITIMSNSINSY